MLLFIFKFQKIINRVTDVFRGFSTKIMNFNKVQINVSQFAIRDAHWESTTLKLKKH